MSLQPAGGAPTKGTTSMSLQPAGGAPTRGTTSMSLQPAGGAPRAEQDVLPHPKNLVLAAHCSRRGRDGPQPCPLRTQSGKVAEAHEPSEALPGRGTPAGHQYVHTRPLSRTERGKRLLLVINDRFSKLTAAVPLQNTNAYSVAIAFCEAWIFKFEPPSQF